MQPALIFQVEKVRKLTRLLHARRPCHFPSSWPRRRVATGDDILVQFDMSPYKSHRVMQYNTWRRGCFLATLCLLTPRALSCCPSLSFSPPINLSISSLLLSLSFSFAFSLARCIKPTRPRPVPSRLVPSPEPSPLKHPKSCARRDRTHETFSQRAVAGAYVRSSIPSDFRSSELVKKYPSRCPDTSHDEVAFPLGIADIFADSRCTACTCHSFDFRQFFVLFVV